tara:strand:+ start:30 stop:1193 length:1164 start_codon:yes stop_codon:yes gene_type:complete
MSKISNQSAYPAATPVSGDYLIGTDVSDSNATKTFTVGSIAALVPADTLSEVLTAGNTATNNILLTGDITCTNIIPTNIKDNNGNTGTAGQHLVKSAANALEWGTGTADTLQNVLTAGNTATNDINLTGDINCTNLIASAGVTGTLVVGNTSVTTPLVRPTNIEDSIGSTGLAGQYLRFQPGGIVWETVGANTLQEVLTAGNTATSNVNLTGQINLTGAIIATGDIGGAGLTATTTVTTPTLVATDIEDNTNLNGTAGQYLRKSAANALAWETVVPSVANLSAVLTSGNTATNNIVLTGDLTGTGDITRIGSMSLTGDISATFSITALQQIEAGSYLKGSAANALKLPNLQAYADNTAAAAAGLAVGDVYVTTAANTNGQGILMIRF